MDKQKARCVGFEGAWREGVRGGVRAGIAAGIAGAALRRGLGKGEVGMEADLSGRLRVEVPVVGKRYHDWWVVPRVVALG